MSCEITEITSSDVVIKHLNLLCFSVSIATNINHRKGAAKITGLRVASRKLEIRLCTRTIHSPTRINRFKWGQRHAVGEVDESTVVLIILIVFFFFHSGIP